RQIGESEQRDRAGDCVATLQGAPREIPHENRADRQPCRVRQPVVRLAFPQRLKLGDRFQPSLAAKKMRTAEDRRGGGGKRQDRSDSAEDRKRAAAAKKEVGARRRRSGEQREVRPAEEPRAAGPRGR